MEYRWHLRKPLRLDTVLYYRGTRLLQCTAHDISQQGMYLKTGPAFFAKNVPVEVAFSLPDADGKLCQYHMRAVVVHSDADGIGIMYRDYDGALAGTLRRIEGITKSYPAARQSAPVRERAAV